MGKLLGQAGKRVELVGLALPLLRHALATAYGAQAGADEEYAAAVVASGEHGLANRTGTSKFRMNVVVACGVVVAG
jgi:hypothetical protein